MAAIFVLLLVRMFHGYVSGYPTKGMLKTINMFFFFSRFSYSMGTAEVLATLVRDKVL